MHEFSICQPLVAAVLKELGRVKNKKMRLQKARVVAGEYHHLVPASLKLAYKILTRDTPAEGSALRVKTVPIKLKCKQCGWKGSTRDICFLCRKCGGVDLEITGGKELYLESIEMDKISPPASLESRRTQRQK